MQSLTDLTALVEKYIASLPDLNLDGDDLEEYSTVLLQLQNRLEPDEPSERVVKECLAYLEQFKCRLLKRGSVWRISSTFYRYPIRGSQAREEL